MKKLVCGCFGTIYYANILKDGVMSDNGRIDMTDDAIDCVMNHLLCQQNYMDNGFSGYDIPSKDGTKEIQLCLYDKSKYKLVKIDDWQNGDKVL